MGWGIPCKWKPVEIWGSILVLDTIDFKIKTLIRYKEGHYMMIKGSIQEEDVIFYNFYTLNMGAPKYLKQMLTD